MSAGRAELWVLVISLCAAVWAFTRGDSPRSRLDPPPARLAPAFAALPPGARLLARVDLVRVRQSQLGAALTGGGRELGGLGSLTELCGFDPTEQMVELALAVPERASETAEPALGVVATGDFDAERIIGCAAKVIARRGGTPGQSRIGAFSSVRDRSRQGAEVAVKAGGPVLVGEGSYFRAMLDAADGRGPTLLGDEAHATLREAVGGPGAIGVTFIARPDWLERWVSRDEAEGAPLAAVRAGALRVDLEPTARATLLLSCPSATRCDELGKWAEKTLGRARAALVEQLGSDPLTRAKVSVETNAVRIGLELEANELQKLLLSVLLDAAREPIPSASAEPTPAPPGRPAH